MRLIERIAVYDAIEKGLTTDEIYYRVKFLPDTPAIPISVIEQIKAEIKNYLEDEKYSEDGISDVGIGLELALNIIDRVVKEYTE